MTHEYYVILSYGAAFIGLVFIALRTLFLWHKAKKHRQQHQ